MDPFLVGEDVWWSEARPDEGGRQTVVRELADGGVEDLLPSPWNARSRVHEYGGLSWLPVPLGAGWGVLFVEFTDQRVYLQSGQGEPTPLSPEPATRAADRFADFAPSPDGTSVLCVRERHDAEGTVRRALVSVDLSGSGVRDLVADGDFVAAPTYSPNGRHLAWIRWNHPDMPWDATDLRIADVSDDGRLEAPRTLGGPDESVLQPTWVDDESLYVLSDRSGWWNLYVVATSGGITSLCPREAEFAAPMWLLGSRWFAVLEDGRVVVRSGVGEVSLGLLDPASGEVADLGLPYRYADAVRSRGSRFVTIAGNATTPTALVVVDVDSRTHREIRYTAAPGRHPDWIPEARPLALETPHGVIHGVAYPPRNPDHEGPPGSRPPYLVHIHGGPTSQAQPSFNLAIAFFTSRGIGYFDLNYRGSSGYGRAYRNALRSAWGVADVEDAIASVTGLAEQVGADPERVVITGGSAGGATTLGAVVRSDVFAAGISSFGIADLEALVRETHDFESRYGDRLIGPYPDEAATYVERSPLTHVDDLRCPVLLLQGEDDLVVPPNQARLFAKAAAARGLPHAVIFFPGEAHGWRRAETIVAAAESKLAFLGAVLGFDPPGVAPMTLD
jgi:dipeptidyl aminopeptidase/acylaminoacyl peptidase